MFYLKRQNRFSLEKPIILRYQNIKVQLIITVHSFTSNVHVLFQDANAVLKLQEHLREHRRQLEHEKGQKMLLENKQKLVAKEKNEMQK